MLQSIGIRESLPDTMEFWVPSGCWLCSVLNLQLENRTFCHGCDMMFQKLSISLREKGFLPQGSLLTLQNGISVV